MAGVPSLKARTSTLEPEGCGWRGDNPSLREGTYVLCLYSSIISTRPSSGMRQDVKWIDWPRGAEKVPNVEL